MTPDILPLHLPRSLEVVVAVGETDKPVPARLGGAFVADHARFLDRGILGEGLEEGFVGHFAREIADENAEVRGVPFEEGWVGPGGAAAGALDGFESIRLRGVGFRG